MLVLITMIMMMMVDGDDDDDDDDDDDADNDDDADDDDGDDDDDDDYDDDDDEADADHDGDFEGDEKPVSLDVMRYCGDWCCTLRWHWIKCWRSNCVRSWCQCLFACPSTLRVMMWCWPLR